jgi:hemerythrin
MATPAPQPASLPRIAREHREILDLTDGLRARLDEGVSKDRVQESLAEVLAQVRRHFLFEERLMLESDYPELAGHVAEHRKLLDQLEAVSAEFAAGAIASSGALGLFVHRWVEQHILGFDQRFEAFLRYTPEQAVSPEG